MDANDFYEEDESPEERRAAWLRGEPGVTSGSKRLGPGEQAIVDAAAKRWSSTVPMLYLSWPELEPLRHGHHRPADRRLGRASGDRRHPLMETVRVTSLHELLGQRIMLWVSEEAADSWPDGLAAFILAHPAIVEILDLATLANALGADFDTSVSPEAQRLLADWRHH